MRTRRWPAVCTRDARRPMARSTLGSLVLATLLAASAPRAQTYNPGSSSPNGFTGGPHTSITFFQATTPHEGAELWQANVRTSVGRVKDIRTGTRGSFPKYMTENPARAGSVWFTAHDGTSGRELWQSDGTEPGTTRVRDIRKIDASDDRGSQPAFLTVAANGQLFFTANDGVSGRELWRTEATMGATLVKDIAAGAAGSHPAWLTPFGNRLLFSATDSSNGGELWISDGTAANTTLVKDIRSGAASSAPSDIVVVTVGSTTWAYFAATDAANGRELWRTDGTSANTTLVSDIRRGADSSAPDQLTAVPGAVLFTANGSAGQGRELWISDAAGTRLLMEIRAGGRGSSIQKMVASGSRVWFSADDGTGAVLWRTDGTLATTLKLGGARPRDLAPVGNLLAYSAQDDRGRELWASDGNAVAMLKDIRPGIESSWPSNFVAGRNNRYLLFCAMGPNGAEPWVWDHPLIAGVDLNTDSSFVPELHPEATPAFAPQVSFALSRFQPFSPGALLLSLRVSDPLGLPGFIGSLRLDPTLMLVASVFVSDATGQASVILPLPPAPSIPPIGSQAVDVGGKAFTNSAGFNCGTCPVTPPCTITACGDFEDLTWEYVVNISTTCSAGSSVGYLGWVLVMYDGGGEEQILLDTWQYWAPSEGSETLEGTLEELIPPEYPDALRQYNGDRVELRWYPEHPATPEPGCLLFRSYC